MVKKSRKHLTEKGRAMRQQDRRQRTVNSRRSPKLTLNAPSPAVFKRFGNLPFFVYPNESDIHRDGNVSHAD